MRNSAPYKKKRRGTFEWSLAPEFKELWEVLERINKKIAKEGNIPPWLEKQLSLTL